MSDHQDGLEPAVTRCATHILSVLDQRPGATPADFADASDLRSPTIWRIVKAHDAGEDIRLNTRTVERVLAVTADDLGPGRHSQQAQTGECFARYGSAESKCPCPDCKERTRQNRARRREERRRGVPGLIPVGVCAAHIRDVLAHRPGATAADFAVAADVHPATVRNVLREGPRPHVRALTARRILAVKPEAITVAQDLRHVSGGQALIWVEELQALGWSEARIAEEAGLGISTVHHQVREGDAGKITGQTARAIWGARQRLDYPNPDWAPTATVGDRVRARRQVEALGALGWSILGMREEFGVTPAQVASLRKAPRGARLIVVGNVDRAFRVLSRRKGASGRVALAARRAGFVPLGAWEQGALEDPEALPDFGVIADSAWRRVARARYRDPKNENWLYVKKKEEARDA